MDGKRMRILVILAFPVVLAVGIVLIPVVADYSDHQLAEKAVAQTARWFSGHLIAAIGFAVSILAVVSIDRHLRLLSRSLLAMTLPCISLGAGLYAAGLGADGIGPVAVRAAGESPTAFFDGSGMYVTGVFVAGTILFGIGLLSLVIGSIRAGILKGRSRYVASVGAFVFMVAPAIPSGWALYGVAVAVFGVFVPIALALRREL
ncbi:MAG: hypothetical protein QUS33_10125 [Dehalococcoidia bacterium]|nr:hypothetical protein [Dehalococcoidia bacterium]